MIFGNIRRLKWIAGILVFDLAFAAGGSFISYKHEVAKIQAEQGNAFIARLPAPNAVLTLFFDIQFDGADGDASRLELLENGTRLGPPHALHARIREEGGGAFSHWYKELYFSTSDNSDPRSNGRIYGFNAPYSFRPYIWILALALNSIAFWMAFRKSIIQSVRAVVGYVKTVRSRLPAFAQAGAIPFFVSAAILAFADPYWAGSDSTTMLIFRLDYIPHFPPLYPQVVELAHSLLGMSHALVVALLGFQHLLLILSIAYFASFPESVRQRYIVSALLSVGSMFSVSVHGISTEAVGLSLVIFIAGAAVRIALWGSSAIASVAIYYVALLFAVLTRHPFVVFGAILPIVFFLKAIVDADNRVAHGRWLAASILLMGGVYAISQGIQSQYCAVLERDCTSITWRAGVYRMHEVGKLQSESERAQWILGLQARAPDPKVAAAIPILVENSAPWYGAFEAMSEHPELRGENVRVIGNQAFRIFLTTPGRVWVEQFFSTFLGYFYPSDKGRNVRTYGEELVVWFDVAVTAAYSDISRDVLVRTGYMGSQDDRNVGIGFLPRLVLLVDRIPPLVLMSLSLFFSVILMVRSGGKTSISLVVISMVVVVFLYAVGMALFTVVIPRYVAPVYLLSWASIAMLVPSVEALCERNRDTLE